MEFIRVVPAEVAEYGAAGAIVLAHIRFRCQTEGPGRFTRDGHRWWRVSQTDLGQEVGLSRKAVMAALKSLGGAVSANRFPPFDNQSRSYRVTENNEPLTSQSPKTDSPDQPVSETGQPLSRSGQGVVPNGTAPCPISDTALPIKNLEKRGEAAGVRRAADNPAPPESAANGKAANWARGPHGPRCPKHVNDRNPPDCPGCRTARIQSEELEVAEQARIDRERAAIRRAKDQCETCGGTGQIDLDEDLVARCPDCSTDAARQRIIAQLTARPAS